MRAVFDLDDTICVHKNRDYPNATPISAVIDKMKKLKKDGWEIVIYTARGQVSCNGDLAKIEKRNRITVEEWLRKNNVPCDELIFGKPIGDVYVDDKGMALDDFLELPFCPLKGGSGKRVYRIGNMVRKDLGDDAENYKNWIEDNKGMCKFPKIISYVYDKVTMEYVKGANLCDELKGADLQAVIDTIDTFSRDKKSGFDIREHINALDKHKSGTEFDKIIEFTKRKLMAIESTLINKASYSHGDATLSNIIKAEDGLYFIDPRYRRSASSYLLDFGKVRMSLMNYEKRFGLSNADNSRYLPCFDEDMKKRGIYNEVVTLNLMHICRLYRYKKDKGIVAEMANDLIEEAYGGI